VREAVPGRISWQGKIEEVIFVGAMTHLLLRPAQDPGRSLLVKLASGREIQALEPGAAITLAFDGADVAVVPLERKM
ncbi:MAG: TOBE domain-containing protein, partial [Dongiales bacterium]